MGNIFARRPEVNDELEDITAQIYAIDLALDALVQQESFIVSSSALSVVLLTTAVAFKLYLLYPAKLPLIGILSVLSAICIALFSRRLLNSIYVFFKKRKLRCRATLVKRKAELIDEVKETKSYKIAREIIRKYGAPDDLDDFDETANKSSPSNKSNTPPNQPPPPNVPAKPNTLPPNDPGAVPKSAKEMSLLQETPKRLGPIRPYASNTPIDKLIDYMIGDGPYNRYALICRNCKSHNGLALPDEYSRLTFRCYRCDELNPSHHLRASQPSYADSTPKKLSSGESPKKLSLEPTTPTDDEDDEPPEPKQSSSSTSISSELASTKR